MLRRRAGHGHLDRAGLGVPLLLVAVLAGCGGGDEEAGFSPVVSEPLSKAEFLRQADEICLSSESRIEAAADDLVSAPGGLDPKAVSDVAINIAVPALEAEADAIEALGAPEGDEAEVEAIITATRRGIAQIEADPEALGRRPPTGLRKAQDLAEAYGSRECGFR